ncbi:nitrite reductase, partial [Micromonospora profundi]
PYPAVEPGKHAPHRRRIRIDTCRRRVRLRRAVGALSGAALLAASVVTRFGIFYGGVASARDPRYTVVPQRERVNARRTRADLPAD